MERLSGHDELLARVAAMDPAATTAPLSEGAMSRVIRHAMTPPPRTWSRRRFRLASVGALVGSGGLVLAGVLGIQAASPGLSVFALGEVPEASVLGHGAAMFSSGAPSADVEYRFSNGANLPTGPKTAETYQLVSSQRAVSAAARLARVLGVKGTVAARGNGLYEVAVHGGPKVSTWTSSGIVEWSYLAIQATPTGYSDAESQLPTARRASRDALSLLARLGMTSSLGAPIVSVLRGEVDVAVPIVVDGHVTDEVDHVVLGPGARLEGASGLLATVSAGRSYPTITAARAVTVLRDDHGFVYYGGIAPLQEVVVLNGADVTLGPNAPVATATSLRGAISGPQPLVRVDIDEATLLYATYDLSDGTSWLLPTWGLSGAEHGYKLTIADHYGAYVIAIAPKYVRLENGGPIN